MKTRSRAGDGGRGDGGPGNGGRADGGRAGGGRTKNGGKVGGEREGRRGAGDAAHGGVAVGVEVALDACDVCGGRRLSQARLSPARKLDGGRAVQRRWGEMGAAGAGGGRGRRLR